MAGEIWTLPAQVLDVVDGDTLTLNYNLGFQINRRARVRLAGVNAAEVFGVDPRKAEAVEGRKQAEWVRGWVALGMERFAGSWPFLVACDGFDKYGRDLVRVQRRADGNWIAADLIAQSPGVRMG